MQAVLWHSLAKVCTKKLENRSIFVKVTAKKSVAPFIFGHGIASVIKISISLMSDDLMTLMSEMQQTKAESFCEVCVQ